MTVVMFWHGGSSYGQWSCPEDAEEFSSQTIAKMEFKARLRDPYYPCVPAVPPGDGGPTGWLFLCSRDEFIRAHGPLYEDLYPDLLIHIGPRGGVLVEPA